MRILVTGGAGFIGSHLVDRLVTHDAGDIVILDNLHRGRLENVAGHLSSARHLPDTGLELPRQKPQGQELPEQRLPRQPLPAQFIQADIRDYETVHRAAQGAEIIYHLAAQSNVMGALADVDYSFTTNVMGTYNVLKAARECGVRRVVFTSSREAYGEARYLPVDEDHPLDSKNTYGASKVAGEMYCRVFAGNFGLETAVLRLSNVYGPRDIGPVIPLWLERAQRGESLIVYGGQQVIDFVWVDQVVEALLRAGNAPIVGWPVNVGSGVGTPILRLAERILELIPNGSRLDLQPARAVEVSKFVAKVDRMRELLGIEPPVDPLFGLPQLVSGNVPAAICESRSAGHMCGAQR